jgi:hypothetical protein
MEFARTGMLIDLKDGDEEQQRRQTDDADADDAAEFSFVIGHNVVHLQAKKQSQSRQVKRTTMAG